MSLTALLHCRDLKETAAFYEALGFAVGERSDIITVEKSGGKLIFTTRDLWGTAPVCSGTFYFTVTDAEDYFGWVVGKAEVAWPLQDMPYGSREFGIKDCNGYHLAFQQQV